MSDDTIEIWFLIGLLPIGGAERTLVVPDEGYTDEQAAIAVDKLKNRIGDDIHVEVETLESISRTDAGKLGPS